MEQVVLMLEALPLPHWYQLCLKVARAWLQRGLSQYNKEVAHPAECLLVFDGQLEFHALF